MGTELGRGSLSADLTLTHKSTNLMQKKLISSDAQAPRTRASRLDVSREISPSQQHQWDNERWRTRELGGRHYATREKNRDLDERACEKRCQAQCAPEDSDKRQRSLKHKRYKISLTRLAWRSVVQSTSQVLEEQDHDGIGENGSAKEDTTEREV